MKITIKESVRIALNEKEDLILEAGDIIEVLNESLFFKKQDIKVGRTYECDRTDWEREKHYYYIDAINGNYVTVKFVNIFKGSVREKEYKTMTLDELIKEMDYANNVEIVDQFMPKKVFLAMKKMPGSFY